MILRIIHCVHLNKFRQSKKFSYLLLDKYRSRIREKKTIFDRIGHDFTKKLLCILTSFFTILEKCILFISLHTIN